MVTRKLATIIIALACLLLGRGTVFGEYPNGTPEEKQEYERDYNRVTSLRTSLSQGKAMDLKAYEKFADDIAKKWREKNRVDYAKLMMEIDAPLSSGDFKESRQYDLMRKYALSALEKPDEIPIATELDLIGYVATAIIGPDASKGEQFAERRKEDVAIRIHAWKRLIDAIDPNWDPNDEPSISVVPPLATGLPSGVAPEAIKDAKLRKEYEAVIKYNRQKAEKYLEQNKLRKWQKSFPKRAEEYIVRLYSHPPFDTEQLKKMLDDFPDPKAKERIINAVEKNNR
jgi:hypothetical protein